MIATLAAAAVLALQSFNPDVGQLGWLSGHWRTEAQDQEWTEELWSGAEGRSLIGVSRTVRGDQTRFFEFMRIATDDQGPAFFGSPAGAPAVRFGMVEARHNVVAFENARHDYPQRIVYRRDGDTLTATISRADGSQPHSWTFKRRP